MKRIAWLLAAGVVLPIGCAKSPPIEKDDGKLDVLCSFFPIYLFTKNVVGDRPNVHVTLMLPAEMGCPHDYDLKPDDVKMLAAADLFVMNGSGLEEFTEDQLHRANAKVKLVDSSRGVDAIKIEDEHGHEHGHEEDDHDHAHEHAHDHGAGVNPHYFSSPRQAAAQVMAIAEALAKADPAGAETYRKNASAYAARLGKLADEYKERLSKIAEKKIVTMHEVFDYLARDCGLEVVGTIHSAPGHDPSAGQMRKLIEEIKKKKAAAVFVEPQYQARIGETIAKDAGIPVHVLDPVASGPKDAAPDYYEKKMRQNLETLEKALSKKPDSKA